MLTLRLVMYAVTVVMDRAWFAIDRLLLPSWCELLGCAEQWNDAGTVRCCVRPGCRRLP